MSNPKRVKAFKCTMCGMIHQAEIDAQDCCPPKVEQVEAFTCPECGTLWPDKKQSAECCGEST